MKLEVLSKIEYFNESGIIIRSIIIDKFSMLVVQEKFIQGFKKLLKRIDNLTILINDDYYIYNIIELDSLLDEDMSEYVKIQIDTSDLISYINMYKVRLQYFNASVSMYLKSFGSNYNYNYVGSIVGKEKSKINWLDNIIKQLENYENLGDFT